MLLELGLCCVFIHLSIGRHVEQIALSTLVSFILSLALDIILTVFKVLLNKKERWLPRA